MASGARAAVSCVVVGLAKQVVEPGRVRPGLYVLHVQEGTPPLFYVYGEVGLIGGPGAGNSVAGTATPVPAVLFADVADPSPSRLVHYPRGVMPYPRFVQTMTRLDQMLQPGQLVFLDREVRHVMDTFRMRAKDGSQVLFTTLGDRDARVLDPTWESVRHGHLEQLFVPSEQIKVVRSDWLIVHGEVYA